MNFALNLLLSLDGRIGRAKFWIGTLILLAISFAAEHLILALVGVSDAAVKFSAAVAIALAYPSYALMAKRFQDRDRPGVLALLGIVPVYAVNFMQTFGIIDPYEPTPLFYASSYLAIGISLWLLVELGLLKGTQGPNRFGPDPLGHPQADARL